LRVVQLALGLQGENVAPHERTGARKKERRNRVA